MQRSAKSAKSLKWSGWTERGKRPNNEDSFLGLRFDAHEIHRLGKFGDASLEKMDYAFAISDGMGGALAGEYASRVTVEKITSLLPRSFQHSALGLESGFSDLLTELFTQVHRSLALLGSSYEECAGMEATLTLCWFTPEWVYYAHVGDSRLYYLPKKGKMRQLTQDDTHVGWLLRTGQLSEYEARTHPRRKILQKALGGSNQFVEPQVGAVRFEKGDIFLLCTDGLNEGLYDERIPELLLPAALKRKDANPAKSLVDASLENSGEDNTTALVIQVT